MWKYYLISAILVLHYYGVSPTEIVERTSFSGGRAYEARLEAIVEEFRQLMCREIPSLGLPRLEPLSIENFDFDFVHKVGDFKGYLKNVTAKGLSNLVVNKISASIALSFSADITLTSLNAVGKYKLKGIFAQIFPIDGQGNLELGLKNLRIVLSGRIKFVNDEFLINNIAITPTVEKVTANIENIVPDKELSDFINEALNTIGPQLFDALWVDISPDVIKLIEDLTKELGAGIGLEDVWGIITGSGPVFPETGGESCFPEIITNV